MAQFEWLAHALSLICGNCSFSLVRVVLSGALGNPSLRLNLVTVFSQQPSCLAITSFVWFQSVMELKSTALCNM